MPVSSCTRYLLLVIIASSMISGIGAYAASDPEIKNDDTGSELSVSQKKQALNEITDEEFAFTNLPDFITGEARKRFYDDRALELLLFYEKYFPNKNHYDEVLYLIGSYYYDHEQYKDAAGYYERYIKRMGIEGQTEDARYKLGSSYIHLEKYEAAIPVLYQVIDYHAHGALHYSAYKQIAACYHQLGDKNRRILTFENAAGYFHDPNIIAECYLNIARILIEDDDFYEASWYLQKIQQKYPHTHFATEALFLLGQCYDKIGELSKAQEVYKTLIGDRVSDVAFKEKAIYALADSYFAEGNYKDASVSFFTATKKYPDNAGYRDALFHLAESYLQLSLDELALDVLTMLKDMKISPVRLNDVLFYCAKIYYERKEYDEALTLFDDIKLVASPDKKDILNYYRGMACFELKKYREAFEYFLNLKHQSSDKKQVAESIYMLGKILMQIGKFQAAIPYLHESIEIVDTVIEIQDTGASDDELKQYRTPENITFFKNIKKDALYTLANSHFEHNQFVEAAGYYQEITNFDLSPHDRAWLLYNIGKCYENSKDYKNSALFYNKVVTMFPDIDISRQAAWDLRNIQWKKQNF